MNSRRLEAGPRYVDYVEAIGNNRISPVSKEIPLSNKRNASMVVHDDLSVRCYMDRPSYEPGDVATLTIGAPFPGWAWVTVEADEVLYETTVELKTNLENVEIPIESDFFPNAYVCVYLVKPGGERGIPLDRFGATPIRVRDPDRILEPAISLKPNYVPGDTIKTTIHIPRLKSYNSVEVNVFAVDKNLQLMGNWSKPDFEGNFFPKRRSVLLLFALPKSSVLELMAALFCVKVV